LLRPVPISNEGSEAGALLRRGMVVHITHRSGGLQAAMFPEASQSDIASLPSAFDTILTPSPYRLTEHGGAAST